MSSSERARGAAPGRTGGSRGSSAGSGRRGELGGLLLLLLLLLGLLCELPSAGAQKEQKARESQPVPLTLISCTISSPHLLDLTITGDSWYWKSQTSQDGELEPFEFKGGCQKPSSFLRSEAFTSVKNWQRGDASLQLLGVHRWDGQYCYEMVNISSKSQKSILLQFGAAQPDSTGKARENITVTCTPSCFSPQNIRMQASPVNISCTLEQKNMISYQCPDIEPSALLTCQARNSTSTGPKSVNNKVAIPVSVCVLAIFVAVLIYCLRRKRPQRNPQQSVPSENYSKVPTESTVAGSDVPTPPTS